MFGMMREVHGTFYLRINQHVRPSNSSGFFCRESIKTVKQWKSEEVVSLFWEMSSGVFNQVRSVFYANTHVRTWEISRIFFKDFLL